MHCLLLRFDAPLMSFGGIAIDQINPIERFPGRSLLTGLLGNALGWDHRDTTALVRLQGRLRHAARWDAEPEHIVDYQTVDLGQDHLVGTGWTTRGKPEMRAGAKDTNEGTHQRYRHYWANGVATVALALVDDEEPDLDALQRALLNPTRPLFIGRKPCLPAAPLLLGRREAPTLRDALASEALADIGPRCKPAAIEACWPAEEGTGTDMLERYDLRDWPNNVHRGTHAYVVGFLEPIR